MFLRIISSWRDMGLTSYLGDDVEPKQYVRELLL
jgi:hypothetical protein